jgi:hypothetical protein
LIRDKFASCIYARRTRQADALLAASDTMTISYDRLGLSAKNIQSELAMGQCLSSATSVTGSSLAMKMGMSTVRAMLLEQAYRRGNTSPPAWLSTIKAEPPRAFVSSGDDLAAARASAAFADCLVSAAPLQSDAMLRTPSGSAEEKAALKALVPFLGPCVPTGQTLKLNLATVRAYVADGLWTAWRAAGAAPRATAEAAQP